MEWKCILYTYLFIFIYKIGFAGLWSQGHWDSSAVGQLSFIGNLNSIPHTSKFPWGPPRLITKHGAKNKSWLPPGVELKKKKDFNWQVTWLYNRQGTIQMVNVEIFRQWWKELTIWWKGGVERNVWTPVINSIVKQCLR